MAIMKMIPATKDYIWGGRRLIEDYGKTTDKLVLAESWELSCHPDGNSLISRGEYGASSLAGYLALNGEAALGRNCARFGYQLPILIKLIDAASPLSVQVHPDDAYARIHENQNGKTEVWHIIDSLPESYIYYGVAGEVTKEQLREAIRDNTVAGLLKKQYVNPGDTYFIEAGTIHAIGQFILLAEVQQNSNVTYRLYDYDRRDAEGNRRPLHIDKGVAVSRLTPNPEHHDFGEHLAICDCFCLDRLDIRAETRLQVGGDSFVSLLCTEGSGIIHNGGDTARFAQGDCFFIPASSGEVVITGEATLLKTTVPPEKH